LHALGALLDRRSYVDETNTQRHMVSFRSALFLEQSIQARRERAAMVDKVEAAEELRMSESIILKAQSLCNYALDGAGPEMSGCDALDECLKDLDVAIEIRARLHDAQLPETHQAVGYVHYVRATCVMEKKPEDKLLFTSDLYATPQALYKKCLEPYFECLGMYHERDGPDAETTLRMQCNLALVYGQLSRIEPELYVETAEVYYKRAIEESTRLSGKTHRRTRRLHNDLKEVVKRKERLEEALAAGRVPVKEDTIICNLSDHEREMQEKRDAEAKALMEEFLAARKQERGIEQNLRLDERAAAASNALALAAAAITDDKIPTTQVGVAAADSTQKGNMQNDVASAQGHKSSPTPPPAASSTRPAALGSAGASQGAASHNGARADESRSRNSLGDGGGASIMDGTKALGPEDQARHRCALLLLLPVVWVPVVLM
jgi:hypothetical protein